MCSGTKERYSGKAHDTKELVEKAKLDVVVFRYHNTPSSDLKPNLPVQSYNLQPCLVLTGQNAPMLYFFSGIVLHFLARLGCLFLM